MFAAAPAEKNADTQFLHVTALPQRIFFPNTDSANSTARLAVWLRSSITGLTSTISKLVSRPWSAMISIAR